MRSTVRVFCLKLIPAASGHAYCSAPCFARVWLTSWAMRKRRFCSVFGDPSAGPDVETAIELATARLGWAVWFQCHLVKRGAVH